MSKAKKRSEPLPMNHSTLFHQPFAVDYPVNSSGFSIDDDDHRRANSLGQRMAQPVSIPATNGLRYNTQSSAMHDIPFDTSPTMLMSPADSCSEPFSPASNSLYSHSSSLSYDRLSDFRPHRVTPLQPPTSQQGAVNSSIFGRNDSFPGSYTPHRGPFLPLSGYNDRMPPYTGNPRVLDSTIDRPSGLGFGQTGNVYMDPMQRFTQSTADAPPFNDTDVLHHPIIGSGGQTAKPEIQAKIHNKKFLKVDDKWTCYRRNYLAISCSFSLHPWSPGPFHLKTLNHGTEQIHSFSMSISATVNAQHEEVRELVQHTPKRDKQSERPPGRVRLQPLQQPTLGIGRGTATSSNGQHGFTLTSQPAGLLDYSASYASASQSSQPPTHHTFERIQFQKATANNGKRRLQQQYYNLMVELYAEIATPTGSEWVKIARRISQPMVVRGRSPGHYRDGRPDSSSSMGPEGNGSSDGSMLHPGVSEASLALMSYDPSERGGMAYSRGPDYSHSMKPEQSPLGDSPRLSSSSSSSALGIGMLNDSMDPMDTIKGYAAMSCPPSQRPPTVATTTAGGSYRHPLSSFDYDIFSKESDTGAAGSTGSSFPDAVGSIVSMMPHDQNEFLRNPPHLPSQHSQASSSGSGGYETIYSNLRPGDDSSSYRFDSIPNPQGLCT